MHLEKSKCVPGRKLNMKEELASLHRQIESGDAKTEKDSKTIRELKATLNKLIDHVE